MFAGAALAALRGSFGAEGPPRASLLHRIERETRRILGPGFFPIAVPEVVGHPEQTKRPDDHRVGMKHIWVLAEGNNLTGGSMIEIALAFASVTKTPQTSVGLSGR